jgi:hypothetical protein
MWADAPTDDTRLEHLLEAAQEECETYAPALAAEAPVPARYVEALVLQAKEGFDAARRNGDLIGGDDYPIRVRPLSDVVRQKLRPRNPVPRFGVRPTA